METIKIGGADFRIDYVLSFESKEDFVKKHLDIITFHGSPDKYLEDVWDLAHRKDDFKTKDTTSDGDTIEVTEQITDDKPEVKRVRKSRKAEDKIE